MDRDTLKPAIQVLLGLTFLVLMGWALSKLL